VFRQRPVAGFTSHTRVFAGGPGFALVIMAKHALVLTGIGQGMRPDLAQSTRAIVPVLAKGLRHNGATNHEKDPQSRQQNHCRPHQVRGISEKSVHVGRSQAIRVPVLFVAEKPQDTSPIRIRASDVTRQMTQWGAEKLANSARTQCGKTPHYRVTDRLIPYGFDIRLRRAAASFGSLCGVSGVACLSRRPKRAPRKVFFVTH